MLLLLLPLPLASEAEEGEEAFLASFPSEKKHSGDPWVESTSCLSHDIITKPVG